MNVIESGLNKDKLVKVGIDEYPEDVFNDWDSLGHIVGFHRRYNFGKKDDIKRFKTPEDFEEFRKENKGNITVYNLFMYEHSRISLSVDESRPYPFNCRWDSGQLGYLYVLHNEAREWYGKKRLNKKLWCQIKKHVEQELKDYTNYINGEVYRLEVYDITKCDLECYHLKLQENYTGSIFGYDTKEFASVLNDEFDLSYDSLVWFDKEIDETNIDEYMNKVTQKQEQHLNITV